MHDGVFYADAAGEEFHVPIFADFEFRSFHFSISLPQSRAARCRMPSGGGFGGGHGRCTISAMAFAPSSPSAS